MTGREEQLNTLNEHAASGAGNLTILYGRPGIGKTTLIREFLKDHEAFYFEAVSGADFELRSCMARAAGQEAFEGYGELFSALLSRGLRIFIFDEFQNIVKNDAEFMPQVASLVRSSVDKVMVICVCSSVSWVENAMVRAIGAAAFAINTFMKLKEFSYMDMVNAFPNCDAKTVLSIYAVTGGVPRYVAMWDGRASFRENVCRLFLAQDGALRKEAEQYIREEFRETGVYFTILHCLASNRNKLNEIHEYTGYGRDKISVYLKNMIDREIVEKVFSYDIGGNENTKKGLYRIRERFVAFWFAYIYPQAGILSVTEPEDFYDRFIAPTVSASRQEAYEQVACEFLQIMNEMGRLGDRYEFKGGWYGKKGNLELVFAGEKGDSLIGRVFVKEEPVTREELDKTLELKELSGLKGEKVYLFSLSGFTDDLMGLADERLGLVDIRDL